MEPAPDRDVLASDVLCPRCGYNLRGLPQPRCPECGLTFPPEQWASGVLREHLPSWLDRCDPWQPHQVLVRSLFEVFRGAWRPRWVLTKLDLSGPLTPAVLMLVCGTLWLYVLATVLIAAATMLHTGASPYASLKSAALWWGPRVVIVAVLYGLIALAVVNTPQVTRMRRLGLRGHLRLASHWVPAMGLYVVVLIGLLLLLVPSFLMGAPHLAAALPIGLAVALCWRQSRVQPFLGTRWQVAVCVAFGALGAGCAPLLSSIVLPGSLEPPLWVYF
jgi:hypothetical protein